MLNMKSLNLAESIVSGVLSRDAIVTPVDGSLLSLLSSKSVPPLVDNLSLMNMDRDTYFSNIIATTNSLSPLDEGSTSHDRIFIDAVSKIGASVSNHMAFTQSTVVPIVQQFFETVESRMKNAATVSSLNGLEVVSLKIPALLNELEATSDALDVTGLNLKDPEYVPLYTNLTIVPEFFNTGDSEHDELIEEWMTEKSPEFFNDVCNLLTTTMSAPLVATANGVANQQASSFFSILGYEPYKKLDYGIALYFITKYLKDRPELVNVNQRSGGAWFSKNINAVHEFSRGLMKNSKLAFERIYRTKELVLAKQDNKDENKIFVDDRVYQEWLSSGGSVEALLGILVGDSKARMRFIHDINEKIPELIKSYDRFRKVADASWKANSFVRFKEILSLTFNDLMQGLSDSEKEYIKANPAFIPTANSRFEGFLASVRPSDMDELGKVCMKLVCRVRFSYTDSEDILSYMDDVSKADPTIKPDEASSLAAINQITKFVVSQLKLVAK